MQMPMNENTCNLWTPLSSSPGLSSESSYTSGDESCFGISPFSSAANLNLRRPLSRSHSCPTSKATGGGSIFGSEQSDLVRYKTELCHPFEENGTCKYGDKCQFAHGKAELRELARHPKYKTELCKTFHQNGYCPYGGRCHFIHDDGRRKQAMFNPSLPATPSPCLSPVPSSASPDPIPFLANSAAFSPISYLSAGCSPPLSPPGQVAAYDYRYQMLGQNMSPAFPFGNILIA